MSFIQPKEEKALPLSTTTPWLCQTSAQEYFYVTDSYMKLPLYTWLCRRLLNNPLTSNICSNKCLAFLGANMENNSVAKHSIEVVHWSCCKGIRNLESFLHVWNQRVTWRTAYFRYIFKLTKCQSCQNAIFVITGLMLWSRSQFLVTFFPHPPLSSTSITVQSNSTPEPCHCGIHIILTNTPIIFARSLPGSHSVLTISNPSVLCCFVTQLTSIQSGSVILCVTDMTSMSDKRREGAGERVTDEFILQWKSDM